MNLRFPLCVVLFAFALATEANAGTKTASLGVSAMVIASCRVEIPAKVESPAAIPAARLTCTPSSRPALRTVIEHDRPQRPATMRLQALAPGGEPGTDYRWVRYDVEY